MFLFAFTNYNDLACLKIEFCISFYSAAHSYWPFHIKLKKWSRLLQCGQKQLPWFCQYIKYNSQKQRPKSIQVIATTSKHWCVYSHRLSKWESTAHLGFWIQSSIFVTKVTFLLCISSKTFFPFNTIRDNEKTFRLRYSLHPNVSLYIGKGGGWWIPGRSCPNNGECWGHLVWTRDGIKLYA